MPDTKIKPPDAAVGAALGKDALWNYTAILGWIADTKKKIPKITADTRKEAFGMDPLTRGIIEPFLKNIILSDFEILTADNKKYEACIEDQKAFLEDIELMKVFREDFADYAITFGHSYRRKDYDGNVVEKLQRIEPGSTHTYEDPWDSTIKAYHQKIYVQQKWSVATSANKLANSWFIPGGKKIIESEGIEEDGARVIWDEIRTKYNISDVGGLRVDAAEKVIAMHKVRQDEPAPIDSVILNIWLKKLIMVNGPNFIFRVLIPFIHIQNGITSEATMPDGTKTFISTVPETPPAGMASTDPEKYSAMTAAQADYAAACQTDVDNVAKYIVEGGIFSSGPDKKLNIIESGRSISAQFIQTMISMLNEEIGQAFGFPVSLIMARGAELATTGTILNIFNTAYAGSRQDYENIANDLLWERFVDETWNYSITKKDGTIETGTYTFEETASQFKLKTGDQKDALKEAQVRLVSLQGLQIAKAIGAGKADVQALGDEAGFGMLDLEKFDSAGLPAPAWGQQQMQSASLKDMKPELIPKNEDELLKDELMKAYQASAEAMKKKLGA